MPKTSLIKIIPRPAPKVPKWANFLFWVSLALLLFSGAVFLFLHSKISSLKEKKENLTSKMGEIETQIREAGEEKIVVLAEKIKNFSELFRERKLASKLFEFLKTFCHPRVQFTDLKLDSEGSAITIKGITENFKTLGEQLLILKENKDVKDLKISNMELGEEGRVIFQLDFTLSGSSLKR